MTLFERIQSEINTLPVYALPEDSFFSVAADTTEIRVFKDSEGDWQYHLRRSSAPAALKVSADYRQMEKQLDGVREEEVENYRFLLRTAFECRFCHEGIVSLHAACVEKEGFAVAFTGKSGAGKSTRARAWVEGLGASWVSGDRPAIRLEAEGCTACGVPWDGKEQIFRNAEVPLRCILEVRRSPVNYIRKLSMTQARQVLAQQTFIPMWDTDTAALALANIRRMIRLVPVYRVFCGRALEDAQVIYDILARHPEQIREEREEMKIKNGFVLRNVVDEYMVMPTGDNIAKFDGTAVLNEVSAFVFRQMENPVSREDVLDAILAEFEVDEETAAKDLDALLAQFRELGLLEE
jgi:hypothetical protein